MASLKPSGFTPIPGVGPLAWNFQTQYLYSSVAIATITSIVFEQMQLFAFTAFMTYFELWFMLVMKSLLGHWYGAFKSNIFTAALHLQQSFRMAVTSGLVARGG